MRSPLLLSLAAVAISAGGCATAPEVRDAELAPGVVAEMAEARFWLAGLNGEAERVLLTEAQVAALNARNAAEPWAFQDVTSPGIADRQRIRREQDERAAWVRERLEDRRYVEPTPGTFEASLARVRAAEPVDELRALSARADLRCLPMAEPLWSVPVDERYDRNQCSGLHPGEVVRVLARTSDGTWSYVHAGHSVGWVTGPDWTAPLTPDQARERLRTSPRPLTRQALFSAVLERLGVPYAWGERRGGIDCSRLMLDAFAKFGVRLGRHSSAQSQSGWKTVDVSELGEADKRAAIRAAMAEGAVIAWMPGHVFLMLGEHGGHLWAVSAIADYLEPGAGGSDRVVRLGRVAITSLELGRGTERTAFIERIRRLAVFGAP